jgi:hypothetical protein
MIGSHPQGARRIAEQRDGTGDVEKGLDITEGGHVAAQPVGMAEAWVSLGEISAGEGSYQGTASEYVGAAPNSPAYREAGGASGGGSGSSTALANYTGGEDTRGPVWPLY